MFAPHLRALATGAIVAAPGILLGTAAAYAQSPCGPTTTVQPGDTFFAIAQRCDVSVDFIEQANPGVDPYSLQIGQTLQLTADAAPPPAESDGHQVQPGDTLFSIAQAMGVTLQALLDANSDIDPADLPIGEIIRPPGWSAPDAPQPETQVSGILTGEGVECQAMRGHDGQLYTLVGNLEDHQDGDLVRVRGEVQEVSFCQQGTTIDVAEIDRPE